MENQIESEAKTTETTTEKVETVLEPKQTKVQAFWELVRFAVIAMLIVIPVRIFVAQPFVVSGSSMYPTFLNGDYLIIDEISYHLGNPDRYDVAVFRYPNDPKKFFIKRIIGLPNEIVDVVGNQVTITNKGTGESFIIEQPYVTNPSDKGAHFELGEGEYFVMGDNRAASSDSRYWGAVPRDHMVGQAFIRLLPIKNIDLFPGAYIESNN